MSEIREPSSPGSHTFRAIPLLFQDPVEPSLLHGDLWSGNVGSTEKGAVSFDASSFYGHSEWDLGITRMFGGFTQDFYKAYHAKRPKSEHYEAKQALYRGVSGRGKEVE